MAKTKKKLVNRQPTPRQLRILTIIRDCQREFGYAPTMQEIADEIGVSKITVFEHVEALIEKGVLRRVPHMARSLELTSKAKLPDERPTLLPLAGRIAAGHPIEAIEGIDAVDLESMFNSGRGQNFVLQVSGDSMIEDQIRDGDYVVVEKKNTARNGQTVVALLNDEDATLKKYFKEKNRIRLQPANKAYKPIYAKKVKIQGVVIGVLRTL